MSGVANVATARSVANNSGVVKQAHQATVISSGQKPSRWISAHCVDVCCVRASVPAVMVLSALLENHQGIQCMLYSQ